MANLSVVVGADTTGFIQSVNEAKNVLEQYKNEAKNSSNEIRDNVSVSNEQVAAYNRVVNALNKVGSGTMTTAQQSKSLKTLIQELKIQWANLSESAKSSDFGKSISQSLKSAEKQLESTKKQLEQTTVTTKGTGKQADNFGLSLTSLSGVLTKVAGAVGIAYGAAETFTSIMRGSQQTSDAFDNVLNACKVTINNFQYALATCDFSAFNNGLNSMITKAIEALQAVDLLGNALMSYGIISAKAQNKIARARAVLYNPKATKADKEAAKKDLADATKELADAAKVVIGDYQNTIIKEVSADSNTNLTLTGKSSLEMIDKWLTLDATKGRKKAREYAELKYAEYQKAVQALARKPGMLKDLDYLGFGTHTTIKFGSQYTQKYYKELDKIKDLYKDVIVYNTLLSNYQDEQLDKLGLQRIAMINIDTLNQQLLAMQERINDKMDKSGGGSGTGKTNKTPKPKKLTPEQEARLKLEEAKKLKKAQEEAFEARQDFDRELAETATEQSYLYRQADIDIAPDSWEKRKKQLELDKDREKNQIEQDYQELIDAKVKGAKALFDANPENDTRNFYTSDEYKNANQLTANEQDTKNKRLLAIDSKYVIEAKGSIQDLETTVSGLLTKLKNGLIPSEDIASTMALIKSLERQIATANLEMALSASGASESTRGVIGKVDAETSDTSDLSSQYSIFQDYMSKITDAYDMGAIGYEKAKELIDAMNEEIESLGLKPINVDIVSPGALKTSKIFKSVGENLQNAGSAFTALSQLTDDKTFNIMGIVGQALGTLALSFANALTTCKTWYEWLAFGISGTATMLSMAALIKQTTSGYSTGGIVKGGSTIGDLLLARLNGGEIVMNGNQLQRLWNILNGTSSYQALAAAGGNVEFVLYGSDLHGSLKNYQNSNPYSKL